MTKHLITGLLLLVGTITLAGEPVPSRLEKRIEDDGKTLSIQIEGVVNGREIRYRRTFDVAGMNDLQKDVLKCRVFYAQGLGVPLHELPGLVFAMPVLAALLIGLLIAGTRAVKAKPANPWPPRQGP